MYSSHVKIIYSIVKSKSDLGRGKVWTFWKERKLFDFTEEKPNVSPEPTNRIQQNHVS